MPNCSSKSYSGKCGRDAGESDYFIYHDALGRCTKLFHLCHNDSNRILGKLMEKELGYTRLLEHLKKKIDSMYHDISRGDRIAEERQKIKDAIEQGLPRPKSKKIDEIKNEIKTLQLRRKSMFDIRNFERNNVCRYCGFALAEPETPTGKDADQLGGSYSHANFHSSKGKRRADIMFHTECGITWLVNTIYLDESLLKHIKPKLTGQNTLFS